LEQNDGAIEDEEVIRRDLELEVRLDVGGVLV
jgi:hypothetical protein